MEPSNNLLLIEALLDTLVTFDYTIEAYNCLFDIRGFYRHTIEPPLRPMEPSNNLPFIEALLDTLVTFDYAIEAYNCLFNIRGFYRHD